MLVTNFIVFVTAQIVMLFQQAKVEVVFAQLLYGKSMIPLEMSGCIFELLVVCKLSAPIADL